jgi:hypothetical protein
MPATTLEKTKSKPCKRVYDDARVVAQQTVVDQVRAKFFAARDEVTRLLALPRSETSAVVATAVLEGAEIDAAIEKADIKHQLDHAARREGILKRALDMGEAQLAEIVRQVSREYLEREQPSMDERLLAVSQSLREVFQSLAELNRHLETMRHRGIEVPPSAWRSIINNSSTFAVLRLPEPGSAAVVWEEYARKVSQFVPSVGSQLDPNL